MLSFNSSTLLPYLVASFSLSQEFTRPNVLVIKIRRSESSLKHYRQTPTGAFQTWVWNCFKVQTSLGATPSISTPPFSTHFKSSFSNFGPKPSGLWRGRRKEGRKEGERVVLLSFGTCSLPALIIIICSKLARSTRNILGRSELGLTWIFGKKRDEIST